MTKIRSAIEAMEVRSVDAIPIGEQISLNGMMGPHADHGRDPRAETQSARNCLPRKRFGLTPKRPPC